jgi:hypothetical protein
MKELQSYDIQFIEQRIPRIVKDLMVKHKGLMIGGGFIRDIVSHEKVSDIDLFCSSKEQADRITEEIEQTMTDTKVFVTQNATTIRTSALPIQIIHRWVFDTPEQLVASFDYTIACAAIWYEDRELKSVISDRFYADLAAKRLVYLSPIREEEAGGSLIRMLKFYRRGYTIPLDSFGAVLARLFEAVDQKRINEAFTLQNVITSLLVEVDPLAILEGEFVNDSV